MKFDKLFEPGYISNLKLKNRIIQAPMYTAFAERDGSVSQRLLKYYKERSKGGAGLIIVESSAIDNKVSSWGVCTISLSDGSYIPGLSTLARTIQDHGAKASIQLNHVGRQRMVFGGTPSVAPSRVPYLIEGKPPIVPEELTIEGIKEIVESYGDAAMIAERAGFDMVEIHGGHGYLITQFLSPITNRRGDIYGSNLKDRMRFALEVVDTVRKNVSKDFPIGMRISGSDYVEGGITLEDSVVFARELERAGIDAIHVTGGIHDTGSYTISPMYRPIAVHRHLVESIKKGVNIPVIASGSIISPPVAEDILEKGHADFISLARPLLVDPWWPTKTIEGKVEDIAPCIRCMECLARGEILGRATTCTVNFSAGFEGEYDIKPVDKTKKIAVIGSGPGGMEAARVAALRRHDVTLYERSPNLGGRLNPLSEFFIEIASLLEYLSTQVEKAGVKVVTNKEITVQMIQKEGFDAIILATGRKQFIPDIRGIDKPSVITVDDLLKGKDVGQNVVVIGGGLIGCEIAYLLALVGKLYGISKHRKMLPKSMEHRLTRILNDTKLPLSLRKNIRVIELSENVAVGIDKPTKQVILEGFEKWGIQTNTGLRLDEVIDGGIIAVNWYGGKHHFDCDNVVLTSYTSDDTLLEELEKTNISIVPVGDCVSPRKIYDAIHEGFLAGYRV